MQQTAALKKVTFLRVRHGPCSSLSETYFLWVVGQCRILLRLMGPRSKPERALQWKMHLSQCVSRRTEASQVSTCRPPSMKEVVIIFLWSESCSILSRIRKCRLGPGKLYLNLINHTDREFPGTGWHLGWSGQWITKNAETEISLSFPLGRFSPESSWNVGEDPWGERKRKFLIKLQNFPAKAQYLSEHSTWCMFSRGRFFLWREALFFR